MRIRTAYGQVNPEVWVRRRPGHELGMGTTHGPVRELQAGLWRWKAPHPDWTPGNPADRNARVSSYAIDDGSRRLLLLDPLAVPREIQELAAHRETVVVLTCPWHERDTRSLVDTFDTHGCSSARRRQPRRGLAHGLNGRHKAHVFGAGDRLPVGVTVFPGKDVNDVALWVEESPRRRAWRHGDPAGRRAPNPAGLG